MIQNDGLCLEMDRRIISAVMEMQPGVKLLPGIQGQQIQFQQQLCGPVSDNPETIHQLTIHIIVDFKPAWRSAEQHSAASTKDFDIAVVFLREYGVNNRQQAGLVADAGNG